MAYGFHSVLLKSGLIYDFKSVFGVEQESDILPGGLLYFIPYFSFFFQKYSTFGVLEKNIYNINILFFVSYRLSI